MNYHKLEKEICYIIKEQQIKLDYRKEAVSLYFPRQSLCRLLEEKLSVEELNQALDAFAKMIKDKGEITYSNNKDRFCLRISPELSEYVHEHSEQSGFLHDLIACAANHHISLEEFLGVFRRYSQRVCLEEIKNQEFQYLVYFEDGIPDDSYFCVALEENHLTYHRFTKEDYIHSIMQ